MNSKGFSLIELLIVIAIIAMIVSFALPNYLGSRQRARDIKRKEELRQMKNALRLYYNDYSTYPAGSGGTTINGCGSTHTGACPCSSDVDFAVTAASTCDVVYMKKFPAEFGSRIYYYQISSGDDFLLKVALENASDQDAAASAARCPGSGVNTCDPSEYCVCAD